MDPIVYLDHAATSWPKPPEVFEAMRKAMEEAVANPGRGSHRMAVKASVCSMEHGGRSQTCLG